MNRSNASWVAELSRDGPERDVALTELRGILLRNLRRSLAPDGRAHDELLEDTVQDTLVRILERLDQFAGRSQFVTWATSIAIHLVMTELRRRHWRDVSLEALLAESESVANHATPTRSEPASQSERNVVLAKLQEAIQSQLTHKQRTALLAEMKGMPLAEIARQLGSNRNAVYKLTHDSRKKLKQGLEAAGYFAEDILAAFSK